MRTALTHSVYLRPDAFLQSFLALPASGQMRFQRLNALRFQMSCEIELKIIFVDVGSEGHCYPRGTLSHKATITSPIKVAQTTPRV